MRTHGVVPVLGGHEQMIFLLQVGILLTLALLLGRLAARLRMRAIAGELLAGVLLGPSLLAHLAPHLSAALLPAQPEQPPRPGAAARPRDSGRVRDPRHAALARLAPERGRAVLRRRHVGQRDPGHRQDQLGAAATQAMGLEAVFGAFVAGIVIGTCGQVSPAALGSLREFTLSVLAPVFFAIAGLRVDLTALGRPAVLMVAVLMLGVAIVGKFVGAFVGAAASHLTRWEALALGAGMNARGVVQLVVATVGLRLGVLTTAT